MKQSEEYEILQIFDQEKNHLKVSCFRLFETKNSNEKNKVGVHTLYKDVKQLNDEMIEDVKKQYWIMLGFYAHGLKDGNVTEEIIKK